MYLKLTNKTLVFRDVSLGDENVKKSEEDD